jgi:hypothetical protein
MALLPVISIISAKAMLDALTALFTATCTLKIYSGAQPATTLTAEGGTLGATLTFSATAFPASSSLTSNGLATATANAIASETNAPNSITAGHFICVNGSSARVAQGNVGTSGADLNLNTTTITAGDTVAITSFKITLPCGDGAS